MTRVCVLHVLAVCNRELALRVSICTHSPAQSFSFRSPFYEVIILPLPFSYLFLQSAHSCIFPSLMASFFLSYKSARLELQSKEGSFAICHHMGPKAKSSAKRLNQVCRTKCYELTLWVYNFMPFVAICLNKQPPSLTNTHQYMWFSHNTLYSFSCYPSKYIYMLLLASIFS